MRGWGQLLACNSGERSNRIQLRREIHPPLQALPAAEVTSTTVVRVNRTLASCSGTLGGGSQCKRTFVPGAQLKLSALAKEQHHSQTSLTAMIEQQ